MGPDARARRSACVAFAAALAAIPAVAAAQQTPAPWRIVPRVSITETYSDNVTRAPSASARSGWISALAPGVRVEGGGGRVRGFFDYQLTDIVYSNQSQLNSMQNSLNSQLTVEAIDDWLFLEARAGIQQLNLSAFGANTEAVTGAGTDPNRVETSFFQLSPYVRGTISDAALYQLRYNGSTNRTSTGVIPETRTSEWIGRVKNAPSASPVGWSIDGSALSFHNALAGKRENSRLRGSLMYALSPELHLSVHEGIETGNFAGATRQRKTTPGIGVEWMPGARTQLAAIAEKRLFGSGQRVLLSHRTPLMAFRFTDDKDVSVLSAQLAAGGQGSLSGMLSDLLSSSIPDPTARAAAVRSQMEQTGASNSSPAGAGFLTSGATLVRRREASVTWLGRTNTATFTWHQSEHRAIGGSLGLVANTNGTLNLSQQGYSASWSHRLTPRSAITLLDTYLETRDLNAGNFASKTHSRNLLFLTQFGRRTTLSVAARRSRFDSSAAAGFRENALVGTAAMRF